MCLKKLSLTTFTDLTVSAQNTKGSAIACRVGTANNPFSGILFNNTQKLLYNEYVNRNLINSGK